MIAGGFDMTTGALSQFTSNLAAMLIQGLGTGVALLAGSVSGALIGLANGLLVIVFHMPPFVATLGSMFVIMGATLLYNNGQALTLYNQPEFFFLGQGYVDRFHSSLSSSQWSSYCCKSTSSELVLDSTCTRSAKMRQPPTCVASTSAARCSLPTSSAA